MSTRARRDLTKALAARSADLPQGSRLPGRVRVTGPPSTPSSGRMTRPSCQARPAPSATCSSGVATLRGRHAVDVQGAARTHGRSRSFGEGARTRLTRPLLLDQDGRPAISRWVPSAGRATYLEAWAAPSRSARSPRACEQLGQAPFETGNGHSRGRRRGAALREVSLPRR